MSCRSVAVAARAERHPQRVEDEVGAPSAGSRRARARNTDAAFSVSTVLRSSRFSLRSRRSSSSCSLARIVHESRDESPVGRVWVSALV